MLKELVQEHLTLVIERVVIKLNFTIMSKFINVFKNNFLNYYLGVLAILVLLPSFKFIREQWQISSSVLMYIVFILLVAGFLIDYFLLKEKSKILNFTKFHYLCLLIFFCVYFYQFRNVIF